MYESQEHNVLAEAQHFKHQGFEQLDHLLVGEREAKLAVMTAMVMGSNVVLVGEPGGAKSTLARDSYRLIDGIEEKNVSHIPPLADLSPQRLVGGESSISRQTGDVTEKVTTHIEPILNGNTQVMFADEINRAAPHAINAYLSALEERAVNTTSGVVKLNNVVYSVATMNPAEARQGVFTVSAATASRHAFGAVLGSNQAENESTGLQIFTGMNPSPEAIDPVTDLRGLQAMRERAKNNTAFPEDIAKYGIELLKNANNVLREHNIKEAWAGRMAAQTRDISKTLAVLGGQEAVKESNVREAVRFMATGRLGMLGTRGSVEIPEAIAAIITK